MQPKITRWLTFLLLPLLLHFSSAINAQTVGPNNAGTGTNVAIGSNTDWSNPGNITATGTPYATCTFANGTNTDYLQATNFGFSIPSTATILGIQVLINRNGTQTIGVGVRDNALYLVKNVSGSPEIQTSGDNKANSTTWPTSFGTDSYGTTSDLWNLTWTADDINNSNFGVALSAHNNSSFSNRTATVDYMQITVTYKVVGSEPTTQTSNVTFSGITSTGMTVNFTAGNGSNRIVLMKASSAVDSDPLDNTSYTSSATFSSGSQIGTGNYVVYNGTGSNVSVSGLSSSTTYYVSVYEFSGSGGGENYLQASPATGSQVTNAASGDYRSNAASYNWGTAGSWQTYNGSSWVTAGSAPSSSNGTILIRNGHTVSVAANVTVDQVIIESGGQVTVNSGNTLTINNGTGNDLIVNGILQTNSTSGTGGFTNNGQIVFGNGGKFIHNINSNENIPTATWYTGSVCEIKGYTSTTNAPGGLGQSFYNFRWNCSGQTANVNLAGGLLTVNGDFTITSTGTGQLRLNSTSTYTINIGGNLSLSAGTLDLSSGAGSTTINLEGNLSHAAGTITESGTGTCSINFNGTAIQYYTSGGTVSNTINYTVNDGSTLYTGTNLVGNGSSGTFTLASGATLGIGDASGITSSGTTGNIRVSGTRTYNTAANYVYNGTSAQVTGNGLPSGITGNVSIDNENGVTLTTTPTTLSGTTTISNGYVDISNKTLTLAGGANSLVGTGSPEAAAFKGNSSAVFNINGSGTLGAALSFKNDFATETFLNTFTINRSSGAVTLNSDLKLAGAMTLTAGVLTVNPGWRLGVTGGATTLGSAECLVLKSDATGTASFIDNGTISGSGTARIERYLTKYNVQATPEDWKFHFLSSPVGTAQAIMPEFQTMTNTNIDFFMWDEPTGNWINTKQGTSSPFTWNTAFGAGNGAFVTGKGYLVAYPADVTKNFVGKPYTSSGNLVLTCTNNTAGGGWNLLGNPFPSSVDWNAVGLGSGIDNALYYYDNSAARYRYYVALTGGIGTSYSGGSQYIPAMQGFMVHAKTTGTKTVTINNGDRTHDSRNQYYKSSCLTDNVLNLYVEGNDSRDDARVCFYESATSTFDGEYDAYKLFSYNTTVPELYSVTTDNTELAINTLPLNEQYCSVPLGFKPGVAGIFTFGVQGIENFASTTVILLEDLLLGTQQNLRENPGYSFSSDPQDNPLRFLLHFGNTTSVNPLPLAENFVVKSTDGILTITSLASADGQVFVYDITGRIVASENIMKGGEITVNLKGHTGAYILSFVTANGTSNRKVIVN